MNTLIVSGYTPGYADLAGRLADSCRRFGVIPALTEYRSTGDWVANGQAKPGILMRAMLAAERRRPIAWVDADAEVVASPARFDSITHCDVAVLRVGPKEILSGTVWLNHTPGAMWLLSAWEDECRAHPSMWDQSALQRALDRPRCPVVVGKLDPALCFIFDGPRLKRGEPVIVHHQASRDVRAGKRSM